LESEDSYRPKSSSILDDLKRKSEGAAQDSSSDSQPNPSLGEPLPRIRAQADSTKLKQFLNNLSQDPTD
jgi:hypothetical protein